MRIFYIWYCLKVRNCIIRIFRLFFGPNLGFWPPRGDISGVTPWGGHNFFLCFQPYFRKNLGLGWIFMFKLTKMSKNYQNMVKTWNFKFFRHFGTPRESTNSRKNFIFLFSFRCLLMERFMKCRISMNLPFPEYRLGIKTWKMTPRGG